MEKKLIILYPENEMSSFLIIERLREIGFTWNELGGNV